MEQVQESLKQYKDSKFFNSLLEEDNLSPAEKKKFTQELERQGMSVVKKCINNFNAFKKNAGDIWQEYRDFWSTQKEADESVQQKGMFYNLWESNYIVGVVKEPGGEAALKVFNTSASQDEYIAFSTKNKDVVKAFQQFIVDNLKTTMKSVIQSQKDAMLTKKTTDAKRVKEEGIAKKKANLDAFLQESRKNLNEVYNEAVERLYNIFAGSGEDNKEKMKQTIVEPGIYEVYHVDYGGMHDIPVVDIKVNKSMSEWDLAIDLAKTQSYTPPNLWLGLKKINSSNNIVGEYPETQLSMF